MRRVLYLAILANLLLVATAKKVTKSTKPSEEYEDNEYDDNPSPSEEEEEDYENGDEYVDTNNDGKTTTADSNTSSQDKETTTAKSSTSNEDNKNKATESSTSSQDNEKTTTVSSTSSQDNERTITESSTTSQDNERTTTESSTSSQDNEKTTTESSTNSKYIETTTTGSSISRNDNETKTNESSTSIKDNDITTTKFSSASKYNETNTAESRHNEDPTTGSDDETTAEVTLDMVPKECPDALDRFSQRTTLFQTKIISVGFSQFKGKSFCASGMATIFLIGSLYLRALGSTFIDLSNLIGLDNKDEARCVYKTINDYFFNRLAGSFYPGITIFADEKYKFTNKFKSDVDKYIVANVLNLDMNQPLKVADVVNEETKDSTKGKVPRVITTFNLPKTGTQIGFANGILFDVIRWQHKFKLTKMKTFHALSKKVKINYMSHRATYKFFDSHEINAKFLLIPVEGKNAAFLFVLPKKKFEHVEVARQLEVPGKYSSIVNRMTEHNVKTQLPFINITSFLDTFSLLKKIKSVSTILDENTIELNNAIVEDKKAAVNFGSQTAIITATLDGGPITPAEKGVKKADFKATHPFFFLITCPDIKGVVIMSGAVVNPADMTITM